MKCSNCGNDISRRAVFCSHCGAEIKENYHAVNDAIISSASRVNTKVLRVLSIVFALLLVVAHVVIVEVTLSYNDDYRYSTSDKYASKHIEELDNVLAARDYYEIARYYDVHRIRFDYESEKENHYNEMGNIADNMVRIMDVALKMQFSDSSYTYDGSTVANSVEYILLAYNHVNDYEEGSLAKTFMCESEADMEMILKVYFLVNDEEMEIIKNSKPAEIVIFFEERIEELRDAKK